MEDPAAGGHVLGAAEVQQVRVRLPAVEQDGFPGAPRQPELRDERRPLSVPGREVAIVVEPEFADRDHLRRPRELGDPLERRRVRGGRVVRVDSDGRVDVRLRRGQGHRRLGGGHVRADRQEGAHAGGAGPREDGRAVAVERRIVEVRVRVDQHAQASTRKRRRPIS